MITVRSDLSPASSQADGLAASHTDVITAGQEISICSRCGSKRDQKRHCRKCEREQERLLYYRLKFSDPIEFKRRFRGKKRNADYDRQAARERHAWLKAGSVTVEELKAIYAAANGCCHYCGRFIPKPQFYKATLRGFDHVIPRAQGGTHTKNNIVTCCYDCNRHKCDFLAVPIPNPKPSPDRGDYS